MNDYDYFLRRNGFRRFYLWNVIVCNETYATNNNCGIHITEDTIYRNRIGRWNSVDFNQITWTNHYNRLGNRIYREFNEYFFSEHKSIFGMSRLKPEQTSTADLKWLLTVCNRNRKIGRSGHPLRVRYFRPVWRRTFWTQIKNDTFTVT